MPKPGDRPEFLKRIIQVRRDAYGDRGARELADILGIPPKTWENFEAGIIIPDILLLRFLSVTRANPDWLLTGEGPPYVGEPATSPRRGSTGGA